MGTVAGWRTALLAAGLFLISAPALCGVGGAEFNALLERLRVERGIRPVPRAPDAVFLRRAYLKLTGAPPTVAEVQAFLRDRSPGKREALIDRLLDSPGFAELMAMRYGQMFRVKSEFPINMWPNAVQLFHRYLRDAAAADLPFDVMAREMLTSSGSNFRRPQVNFLRGHADRTAEGVARGVALSLMGVRLEKLDRRSIDGMAAFFSRIGRKETDEWKEEIIFTLPDPARVEARTPTGESFSIDAPGTDPRAVFAAWLTAPENPYFARAFANRVWFWLFGRGLIEPADDLSGTAEKRWFGVLGAAPSWPPRDTPELKCLAAVFRDGGFSVKELFRVVCNSPAFTADWETAAKDQLRAAETFAAYPVHRMEPELIIDTLAAVTGVRDRYRSVIPEPFTILPAGFSAVRIFDGSISSVALDNFGRSPRDTGRLDEVKCRVTASQRQWLMNSGVLYGRLQRVTRRYPGWRRMSMDKRIRELYLLVFSRYPSREERETVKRHFASASPRERGRFWADVLWAMVNSREFIYHH